MLGFDLRTAKIVWTAFLICFLLFISYLLRNTFLVIIYAIFFSYLIYPLVQIAERYKPKAVSRTMVIAAVFVLVLSVVVLIGAIFGNRLSEEFSRLSMQLPGLLKTDSILDRLPLPSFLDPVRSRILNFIRAQIQLGAEGGALPSAREVGVGLVAAASKLVRLVLIPVLSFLLIKEASKIRATALSLMDQSHQKLWAGIADDLDGLLAKYVRALLFLSLATLIAYSIAFSLFGLPYALLLAAVAATLEFIPFIGPMSAVVIILGVSIFSGYDSIYWLLFFILLYRIFQDYILNPFLMSEGVEISPLMVIIGLLAGEHLGGVAGIFISVPLMAAIKIIFIRARREAT